MILLDTHIVLWLAQLPERLSEPAREAIVNARQGDGLAISDKSLWEIAVLISSRRVTVKTSIREFLDAVERHFVILPVTAGVAERSTVFTANYPKDPSDRIIGATALANAIQLVTADQSIRSSGEVPCIW